MLLKDVGVYVSSGGSDAWNIELINQHSNFKLLFQRKGIGWMEGWRKLSSTLLGSLAESEN